MGWYAIIEFYQTNVSVLYGALFLFVYQTNVRTSNYNPNPARLQVSNSPHVYAPHLEVQIGQYHA